MINIDQEVSLPPIGAVNQIDFATKKSTRGNGIRQVMQGQLPINRGTMPKMNEKYIQSVLEIERQAQEIQEEAQHEAEELPILAEDEAEDLIQQSRAEAEEEAHQMVANAQYEKESARILAETDERIQHMKNQTMSHFDRAVDFVLDRIAGRE